MKFPKKEKEYQQLCTFKKLYSAFPVGEIISVESPDFIIESKEMKIGIELTQIFRDVPEVKKPLRGQESIQQKIIDKTKLDCSERGIPNGIVLVHFNAGHKLSKNDIDPLSNELSNLVMTNFPPHENNCILECGVDNYKTFPKQFEIIYISHISESSQTSWSITSSSVVPECTVDSICKIIAKKDKNLKEYRTRCDQIWLLIVADGFAQSSIFKVSETTVNHIYETGFDHVFLYQIFEGKVWKLNIKEFSLEEN